MSLPRCCEKEMRIIAETGKFLEAHCEVCSDVVYVKKSVSAQPQMLDD
ncbi:MAG TPA: hypothetical protein VJI12_02025 [archaeon]|nr:hypothetical protein [archaeon]